MRLALVAVVAALVLAAAAAAATRHGFRDAHAPREAAAILNRLPDVDGMRCHWKRRGHTIGCVGLAAGERAQLFVWSGGPHRVMYRVCADGECSRAVRAKHVFGRPY